MDARGFEWITTRTDAGLGVTGTSVSDPCSFDTDPDPIRIQGFDDQKLKKIYS